MADSIFKRIANARATGGGNYIKAGKYELEILKTLKKNGFKGDSYIVEAAVRKAAQTEEGITPNMVGSHVSCAWNLSKDDQPGKLDLMLGHVKAFVMALFNVTEATASTEDIENAAEQITNEDPKLMLPPDADGQVYPVGVQPARGRLIGAVTRKITTKQNKVIDVIDWSPIVQTDEEIAARRAIQEGNAPAASKAA